MHRMNVDLPEPDGPMITTTSRSLEQREEFNAEFLESLKERYEIVIDEIPAERTLKSPGETATPSEAADSPAS